MDKTMNAFGITEAMEGDTVEILSNVGWRKVRVRMVGTTIMTYYDMDGNPGSIGMNQLRGLRAPMELTAGKRVSLTGQDTLIINGKPILDSEALMVERWPAAIRQVPQSSIWETTVELYTSDQWKRALETLPAFTDYVWPYHPGDKLPL